MTSHLKKTSFTSNITQLISILLVVFLIRTFVFGLYQVPTGSMETTMLVGERFFADKLSYLFVKPKRGHVISLNNPMFKYSDSKIKRLFEEYVWGPVNLTKRIIGLPGEHVKGVVEDGKPVIYINDVKLDEPYLNKYPLITVWKTDPTKLVKSINEEAFALMAQNQLSRTELDQFFNNRLGSNLVSKSYDPNASFEAQPFYRIKESLIYRHDDVLLREPGQPIEGTGQTPKPEGATNYWNGTDDFDVVLGDDQYWLMGDNRRNSGDSRVFGPVDGRLIHGRILVRIWSIDSDEDWWILDLIKHPIDFWTRIRWNRFFQWVR
jgi:signal peptidase I